MSTADFTATILVEQTPEKVFKAITNVRGWWSEEIEGSTEQLNDEFSYHFEDLHRCRIKLLEVVPGKKVVWHVLANYFKPGIFDDANRMHGNKKITHDQTEWVDTKIMFEISEKDNKTQLRFTHVGLTADYECFDACSNGWNHYIRESLFGLITKGKGQPNSTGTPMTADEEKLSTANKDK
jgi:hypothetical protein